MTDTSLFAWSVPIVAEDNDKLNNFEHTWVTNFQEEVDPGFRPNPNSPVVMPPKSFWYCWGQGYAKAAKLISQAEGNLSAANGISPANAIPYKDGVLYSNNSGSIEFYGLDGVCHHVANQVLFATGTAAKEPVRVGQANGYAVSSFFYGTYGLNEDKWAEIHRKYMPNTKMPGDDFLPLMQQHVHGVGQQSKLLELRDKARMQLAFICAGAVTVRQKKLSQFYNAYIPLMQLSNTAILNEAEQVLGTSVFNALFQFPNTDDASWMLPT